MSRLLKKLVNWLRGRKVDVRNESGIVKENGMTSASAQGHRSQAHLTANSEMARNTSTSTVDKPTSSRKRKSYLTATVTLEQMMKDGVFKLNHASRLTAADIWGDHTVFSNDAPCCAKSEMEKRIEQEGLLDDWNEMPNLSLQEIIAGLVVRHKQLDRTLPTYDQLEDTDVASHDDDTRAEQNRQSTNSDASKKRKLDDLFEDWQNVPCLSIDEIKGGMVRHEDNHTAQMDDTDEACNTNEEGESLASIWRQNRQQLTNNDSPAKKRKYDDEFDDDFVDPPCSFSDRSENSMPQSTTEQPDHTISSPNSQVDDAFTTSSEESLVSPRIQRRQKRRALRGRGKKRE